MVAPISSRDLLTPERRARTLVPLRLGGAAMPLMPGFLALKDLPEEKVTDKITRRVLTGEKTMIVRWTMQTGVDAAAHSHPHEQVFWVLSGKMDFRLGNERRTCGPGAVAVVPSGVEHEAWFPERTEVIDVFAPPREDFLTGETP